MKPRKDVCERGAPQMWWILKLVGKNHAECVHMPGIQELHDGLHVGEHSCHIDYMSSYLRQYLAILLSQSWGYVAFYASKWWLNVLDKTWALLSELAHLDLMPCHFPISYIYMLLIVLLRYKGNCLIFAKVACERIIIIYANYLRDNSDIL